ncbi:hypothetical protein AB6H35_12335 [Citrobacter freundii]|uniref:hypothetical protein n=1 Tax=Citrobacter freundii TaxID=546 RepID=UPI0034DD1CAB
MKSNCWWLGWHAAVKYSFTLQGSEIALKQAWEAFNNSRRYSDLRLHKVRRHDEAQLTKA